MSISRHSLFASILATLLLFSTSAFSMPLTVVWQGEVTSNTLSRGPFQSAMVGDDVTVVAIVDNVGDVTTTGFFSVNFGDTSGISIDIEGSSLSGVDDTTILFNTQDTFATFDSIGLTQTDLLTTNYILRNVVTDFDPGAFRGTAGLAVNGMVDPRTLTDNMGVFNTSMFTGQSLIEDFDLQSGTNFGALNFLVSSVQIGSVAAVPVPGSLALLGLGLIAFGFMRRKK